MFRVVSLSGYICAINLNVVCNPMKITWVVRLQLERIVKFIETLPATERPTEEKESVFKLSKLNRQVKISCILASG